MIGIAAWLVLAACVNREDGASAEWNRDQVGEEVNEFLARYGAATRAKDVEALKRMYSNSPDFYWVEANRGTAYHSHEEVAAALDASVGQAEDIDIQVRDVRITPLSANGAVVFFSFDYGMKLAEAEFTLTGVITATLIREQGEWRFLTGHSTTLPPEQPG